jgi:DNA-binding response OmpR family regulator
MAARILNISFDESLLRTRHLLLESQGYVVTSTLRFEDALDSCRSQSFELVIIGHSIPEPQKQQFISALRSVCSTPILTLHRHNEGHLQAADYDFDASAGPAQLTKTVQRVLSRKRAAA